MFKLFFDALGLRVDRLFSSVPRQVESKPVWQPRDTMVLLTNVPPQELIESPNILKTGFWIANDFGKLKADLPISPKMCVELHGIAKKVDQAKLEKLGLFYDGTMKFAKMVRLYLEKELAKPNEVRISDWSEDLSEEHLECESIVDTRFLAVRNDGIFTMRSRCGQRRTCWIGAFQSVGWTWQGEAN